MGHGDGMSGLRISAVTVTPVAFADPPLLNSVGVHEPFALRAVVEVSTDDGLAGLGEPGCTSSTCGAGCATGTTPATCAASSPATNASNRAGERS
jgi:L-alanine-DL-glutamate epimerase-like enolase superfamily enzyme